MGDKSKRAILGTGVVIAVIASLYYFTWWTEQERYSNPLLLLALLGMLGYVASQAYSVWYIYLRARRSDLRSPESGQLQSVDVFLPTYNEPFPIIEVTLRAIVGLKYPHTTYVIDDGKDPNVQQLADSLGARYVTREDRKHNKAGNINNALSLSTGEIIAIFDVDHIPQPDFLNWVVPYFENERVGVVQVALDHYNQREGFVAAASARMSDEFFGATMLGMDQCDSAVVFGSNSVFRRSALTSLGGYKPGLAEDLNTSIHLHAGGWKSVYLPRMLAKGLVPADLEAFRIQQFKWARGVFEVLLREAPRLLSRLTWSQRVCYTTRMTYYMVGPVILGHIIAGIVAPFVEGGVEALGSYLGHAFPIVASFLLVHLLATRFHNIKENGDSIDLRGALLALSIWPVYSYALIAAIAGLKDQFVETPKQVRHRGTVRGMVVQLIAILLLGISSMVYFFNNEAGVNWAFMLYAALLFLLHIGLIPATLQTASGSREN